MDALQVGDRVEWCGPDTLHELRGDIGNVSKIEVCGPYLSRHFYVGWARTGKVGLYCDGHIGPSIRKAQAD